MRAIAVLFLILLPGLASAESRMALLIGNATYNPKVGQLKNPHRDIALVGSALKSLGFMVTEVKDADYRSTDAAIKRYIATVRREGQGAISFVYYSGHGAADPNTKINYLIPVDVANADDEASGIIQSISTRSWRTCGLRRLEPPTTLSSMHAAMSSI